MLYAALNNILKDALRNDYPEREIESIGRLIAEHLTGLSWVQIRLNPDKEFTADQESQITGIIARLGKHEPIQYILGVTGFYGLQLAVRPGVLIPRGETEELVQWVITCCGEGSGPRLRGDDNAPIEESGRRIRVLDIGCGSGAIAIAVAKNVPGAEVFAADISGEALKLTRENALLNGLSVQTIHLDILAPQLIVIPAKAGTPSRCTDAPAGIPSPLSAPFDIIISNPPYVPLSEMTAMDLHVVEHEPGEALFVPDADPLLFYRAIAEFASFYLNPGGEVFVEIHDRLGKETAAIFKGLFSNVELRRDIHGKERMIRAYHG